jgi:hypothetical protein
MPSIYLAIWGRSLQWLLQKGPWVCWDFGNFFNKGVIKYFLARLLSQVVDKLE